MIFVKGINFRLVTQVVIKVSNIVDFFLDLLCCVQ